MNEEIKIELGLQKPQLNSSKPTIEIVPLNIPKKEYKKPLLVIELPQVEEHIEPEIQVLEKPTPPTRVPTLACKPSKKRSEDSIIENVDTGFGCTNQLVKDPPKPTYKSHLCKENYLGEFKAESEKALARENLGIYSKEEINSFIENIINNSLTKQEVQGMIASLDFVNSSLKSFADYQIPNNLFKL